MSNGTLTNVREPDDHKNAINKNYFDNSLLEFDRKSHDIDMNGKAIKNWSWPNDNNDTVPKKYLYQGGLLLENKINNVNAKDKKIVNVLDPENQSKGRRV